MREVMRITSLGWLLVAGCATTPPPQLCRAVLSPQERSFPTPDTWFSLLLHGYDAKHRAVPRPAVDCEGVQVFWEEPADDECQEPGPRPQPLPPAKELTEDDLVLSTQRAGLRLVWVITRRFSNGEGLGPVALVETAEKGYEVRALGSLRALVKEAQLRLERVGDTDLLVAEGEACTPGAEQVCRRSARVLPLRNGRRFFVEPLSTEERACLGSAWFPLTRELYFEMPNGLRRRMELASTLSFSGDALIVQEQVSVSDSDPRQPSLPERLYRRAQAERSVKVRTDTMVGSGPSLWARMVEQQVRAGAKPLPETPILLPPPPQEPKEPETAAAKATAASPPAGPNPKQ